MALDSWELINQWMELYNPAPSNPADIESGKRAPLNSSGYMKYPGGTVQPITKGNRQTGACQFWMNGLSSVCQNWDPDNLVCTYKVKDNDIPSGYGVGKCDMLGRRSWCTHYLETKDYNPNEFVCILPCVERSGKGRQIISETSVSLRPILPDEIQGYNPDENGVGRCDGLGMGRADQGPFETIEAAWEKPIVCRYYRPQIMGFGAYQPRPYHGDEAPGLPFDSSRNWVPTTPEQLYDGSHADPLVYMDPRLPYSFQVYNNRAMFQKCAHWKTNRPAFFSVGAWGDNPHDFTIDLDEDPSDLCSCEDSACVPYKNVIGTWDPTLPPMLQYVWAPYGGVVCNGAKPECPCYSGDWVFCTDANMRDGMRISAEQIMELRFWASNWASKAEYDAFYAQKPGPTQKGYADETTSAIYTFKEWEMIDNKNPNKSKMIGMKVDLCQPAPLHMREFIPSEYLIRERLTYPNIEGYTGTNIRGEGVLFPTLLRELDHPTDYVPDLFIVYPYTVKDPWSAPACGEEEDLTSCVHDFNLMDRMPQISVVGYGPKSSEIIVLNSNIVDDTGLLKTFVDTYMRASRIPVSKWAEFIAECDRVIEAADKQGEGVFKGASAVSGFFHISDVDLELNKLNNLYILCKYDDYFSSSDSYGYTFRRVRVDSRYWGALIVQDAATYSPPEDIIENHFPDYYSPSIYMSGQVRTTRGEVATVLPAYFLYHFSVLGDDTAYYSYCINRYTDEVEDVEKWCQVGPSGYIWAEIDNLEINYLMDFKVVEAKITYSVPKDEDGNRRVVSMCGSDPDDAIPLEVVYPDTDSYDRQTVPPNAVLLKAPKPLPFFNSKWKLSIKYTYNAFETFVGEDPVWPVGIDGGYFSLNKYVKSNFDVQHAYGEKSFTIPSIGGLTSRATAKVIAFVSDENGRTQVAAATKLVMQGHELKCRSVDIFYRYGADATAYDLQPSTGFFTWRGTPLVDAVTSDGIRHVRVPACGDHLCGGLCPPGWMWFPFNVCSEPDFYNVLNGAAQCTMKISEGKDQTEAMGPGAVRYGVAEEYRSWVTPGGNWATSCGTSFYYHYSRAPMENMQFIGSGYKRKKVNKLYYQFMDWALPPFGNTGRSIVERYLTRDYTSHIDRSGPVPLTKTKYMPMVFDAEDLNNQKLNCFEVADRYSLAGDPFSCFPVLSNYLLADIEETMSNTRFRWDEILQVISHGNCMYPWPILETLGVYRYGFLDESMIWAWPEYWKPMERNIESSHGEFKFLSLDRQEYFFDYIKEEHRFVPNEGVHKIVFEPPEPPSEDGEGDTQNSVYPSISIDGAYPRFFKIVYDEYAQDNVEWQDESVTGEENASGGDGTGEGSDIYEKTCTSQTQNVGNGAPDGSNNPAWIHDYNTVFSEEASNTPTSDRKALISIDPFTGDRLYGNYNRGLVMTIPKNRLYYLPMEESAVSSSEIFTNEDTTEVLRTFDVGSKFGLAPIRVVVYGSWGVDVSGGVGNEVVYSKTGISVRESTEEITLDGNEPSYTDGEFVGSVEPAYGSNQSSVSEYKITLDLTRSPERFIRRLDHFIVILTPYTNEKIKVNKIEVYVGKYTHAEEEVKVWERRYYVGVSDKFTEDNLNSDGPNTKSYRDYNRDLENSGQYFPADNEISSLENGGHLISKLTMVGASELFTEDEELTITMDNLKDMELEPQRDIYNDTYELDNYDELNYVGVRPPIIDEFLKTINLNIQQASTMIISHYKATWDQNSIARSLKQDGTYWQPGGHYFKWSDGMFKTRCYVFGPIQEVYEVQFVHYKHGGATSTLGAGESYAGWGRLWYYEGRLANIKGTDQEGEFKSTDLLTGAKNAVTQESA